MKTSARDGTASRTIRFLAHTHADRPREEWQQLEDHLEGVAVLAERNAAVFECGEWGRLAGLWHDLGKYSEAFQAYLEATHDTHQAEIAGRVDHSTAGAKHAVDKLGILGHLIAFPIAGHHSGLLNANANGACMRSRLVKKVEPYDGAPEHIIDQPTPPLPRILAEAMRRRDPFAVGFFVRMLFSALVDADFLDTERFMNERRAAWREEWPEDVLPQMAAALAGHISSLGGGAATSVNRERRHVLESCLQAARRPPGLYSLTVPTGGGKTLSSLAFALSHAIEHGLRRIIYVVPFTSIIEQNADVFRKVVAPLVAAGMADPIVEHHSNLDPDQETEGSRLAAENWDAPLIVTTSVQFYESLFANRTSRCRKLHNMARSVIILDEAQALPVEFLAPCLRALDELTENYGATVVLCTATQPAIQRREDFPIGLVVGRDNEIVPDPERLFEELKRVEVTTEPDTLTDDLLADRLLAQDQVLCIVNTRGHARGLAEILGESEEHFHLSALMCPAHRSQQLGHIVSRLEDGLPCRVVATRLIEAGVDVDFPVVFRSLAGLDSIAQAAGRCNRNGRLAKGETVVFRSEHVDRERFAAATADAAAQTLAGHENALSLEAIEAYFRLYFWDQYHRTDAKAVLDEFHLGRERDLPFLFGFARVAAEFKLIEDTGKPVIVPWGVEGEKLCDELRSAWSGVPSMDLVRRLQRYTVQVPERLWRRNLNQAFELVHGQYAVLVFPDRHYSEWTGLRLPDGPADLLMT